MTPKEKALELVEDMHDAPEIGYNEHAKQCALIAVDEILEALKIELTKDVTTFDVANFAADKIIYWQEVKKEIEAL
jgi:hypothetical protein